jgi:hypothetical protein
MEPEGSLSYSQMPATCPYPEPVRSSPCPHTHFLKIHLNIILLSPAGFSKCSLSLRFPCQNAVYTSPLSHTFYMPRPSNSSRFIQITLIPFRKYVAPLLQSLITYNASLCAYNESFPAHLIALENRHFILHNKATYSNLTTKSQGYTYKNVETCQILT